MTAQLYCFGESGNAYKAALTLTLCDYSWEPVFVNFFTGEARSDEFRKLNKMGEVPVFIEGDHKFTQSGVIQSYVSEKTGKLAGRPDDKYEVMRWLLWDNHKMSSQAGMTRFLMNFLPEDKRPQDVIGFMQGRLKAAYQVLETQLEDRDWLASDQITIADTACCGYLFYDEPFGFVRKDWPHIDAWLTRISETPGWKHPYDLMQRALTS